MTGIDNEIGSEQIDKCAICANGRDKLLRGLKYICVCFDKIQIMPSKLVTMLKKSITPIETVKNGFFFLLLCNLSSKTWSMQWANYGNKYKIRLYLSTKYSVITHPISFPLVVYHPKTGCYHPAYANIPSLPYMKRGRSILRGCRNDVMAVAAVTRTRPKRRWARKSIFTIIMLSMLFFFVFPLNHPHYVVGWCWTCHRGL